MSNKGGRNREAQCHKFDATAQCAAPLGQLRKREAHQSRRFGMQDWSGLLLAERVASWLVQGQTKAIRLRPRLLLTKRGRRSLWFDPTWCDRW